MASNKPKEQLPPRLRMAYSTIAALEQDIRALQLQLHQVNSQLDQVNSQLDQANSHVLVARGLLETLKVADKPLSQAWIDAVEGRGFGT